jgi:hypothetical protein
MYASCGCGPAGRAAASGPTALSLSRRHALLEGPLDRGRRAARMPRRGRFPGCSSPAHVFSCVTRRAPLPTPRRRSFCASVPAVTVIRAPRAVSGPAAGMPSDVAPIRLRRVRDQVVLAARKRLVAQLQRDAPPAVTWAMPDRGSTLRMCARLRARTSQNVPLGFEPSG